MADEITVEVSPYSKFLNTNGVCYIFVEVPAGTAKDKKLKAKTKKKDADGNDTGEDEDQPFDAVFHTSGSKNKDMEIALLSPSQGAHGRSTGFSLDDAAELAEFLKNDSDFKESNWLTLEEAKALLPDEE